MIMNCVPLAVGHYGAVTQHAGMTFRPVIISGGEASEGITTLGRPLQGRHGIAPRLAQTVDHDASGFRSPACSAIVQEFFRSAPKSNPSTYILARRQDSTCANRPATSATIFSNPAATAPEDHPLPTRLYLPRPPDPPTPCPASSTNESVRLWRTRAPPGSMRVGTVGPSDPWTLDHTRAPHPTSHPRPYHTRSIHIHGNRAENFND
jgi:hypothetical protein